jgi:hypothetical protein
MMIMARAGSEVPSQASPVITSREETAMSGAVEAGFYISGYECNAYNPDATIVKLQVVSRGEHNKSWAAATPTGQITMTINNASAAAWFVDKLGQEVAVRFELVPGGDYAGHRDVPGAPV